MLDLEGSLSLYLFPVDPVATPRNNGHSPEESTGAAGGLSAKAQAVRHSTPKNISKRDQQMSSVVLPGTHFNGFGLFRLWVSELITLEGTLRETIINRRLGICHLRHFAVFSSRSVSISTLWTAGTHESYFCLLLSSVVGPDSLNPDPNPRIQIQCFTKIALQFTYP